MAAQLLGDHDLSKWASAWNFGPLTNDEATVADLATALVEAWGDGCWVRDPSAMENVEAKTLRIAIDKAVTTLHWQPRWRFTEAVGRTVAWYRAYYSGRSSMRQHCLADIKAYEESMT